MSVGAWCGAEPRGAPPGPPARSAIQKNKHLNQENFTIQNPDPAESSGEKGNVSILKGTGTRDLIWLKVVSLDRSWLVGLMDNL